MEKLRKIQLLRPVTVALTIVAVACVIAAAQRFCTAAERGPSAAALRDRDARIGDLEEQVEELRRDVDAALAGREEWKAKHAAEAERNAALRQALEDAAAKLKTGTP